MLDPKIVYDRYLLAALGVLAAAAGLFIASASRTTMANAALQGPPPPKQAFMPDSGIVALTADLSAMRTGRVWTENTNGASPFVSRVYLLNEGRLVDILESGSQLFSGIDNAWVLQHELDYLDARLPERDPDSDGFTNLEEFDAKTNPRDSTSQPPDWKKLRMVNTKIDKLRFKFESLPRGSLDLVAINTISSDNPGQLSGSTQFYPRPSELVRTAAGEEKIDRSTILLAERLPDGREVFEATPFRFERAELRKRFNPATSVEEEIPVAFISNKADGKEVELNRGEVRDSPYALATFLDTRPGGRSFDVRSGETFQFGKSDQYILIDVSEENATIENLATQERHTVPRGAPAAAESSISPEEKPQ